MPEFALPVSGFWKAEGGQYLSPTGAAPVSEVDEQYVTKGEFCDTLEAQGLGITSSSPIYSNGMLDKYLLNASKFATTFCRQYFSTQTIDEWKDRFTVKPMNPEMVTIHTHNAPIQSLNSMYIQVLSWFVQIQTAPGVVNPYIQIESSWGIVKIVPLLSSSGQGMGSPIPAEFLNKSNIAKLWYNYTFGYGTPYTSYPLAVVTSGNYSQYQPTDYNFQLWAKSQPVNIYVNGALKVLGTDYTITDYANAIVNFTTPLLSGDVVTADFMTNNSIPFDIKMAVIKYACKLISQATQNPGGFDNVSITGYSTNFGGDNAGFIKDIQAMLEPYKRNSMHFL